MLERERIGNVSGCEMKWLVGEKREKETTMGLLKSF